jgi:hypothetical protein
VVEGAGSNPSQNYHPFNHFTMFRKIISSGKDTKKIISAVEKSSIYEVSAQKIKEKAYAALYLPLYRAAKGFSIFYHVLSFISAIALAWHIFKDLRVFQFIFTMIIAVLLAVAFEMLKSFSSKLVFKNKAKKQSVGMFWVVILIATSLYSITTSSVSGYLFSFAEATEDPIALAAKEKANQIDSLNQAFAVQIAAQQSILKNGQAVLAERTQGWRAVLARQDMEKANKSLSEILAKRDSAQAQINSFFEQKRESTISEGNYLGLIVGGIFFVLEMLNLGAYAFVWLFYVRTAIEGKVRAAKKKKERLSSNDNRNNENRSKPTKNIQGFGENAQHLNKLQIKGFTTNDNRKNENRSNLKGVATCKHCGSEYVRNHSKQLYCTEECRIAAWELKNGAKLVKGKNSGKLFSLTFLLSLTLQQELTACMLILIPFLLAYLASWIWIWRKAKRPKPKEKPKPAAKAIAEALNNYCIELDEPLPFVAGEKCEFQGEVCTACGLTYSDLVDIRALEVYAQASRKGGGNENE